MQVVSDMSGASGGGPAILSIGAFDGVHCGHQALLGAMVQRAKACGLRSAVLTFYPHPREVLQPGTNLRYLTTDVERARLLEKLGIDLLVLQPFDRELAATSAEAFLARLRADLQMAELWVGPDFALGRDRAGSIPELQRLSAEMGYRLHVVDGVQSEGETISSTRVRYMLEEGAVAEARRLLGRHYAVGGVVRYGAQRGRQLGFRTANLRIGQVCGCPSDGVYAVWGRHDDAWIPGVANLGRRPSFDLGERLLEVHLMGYAGSLYGKHLRVLFVARLRSERRFDDARQLIEQVHQDMVQARSTLEQNPPLDVTLCGAPDTTN